MFIEQNIVQYLITKGGTRPITYYYDMNDTIVTFV